MKDNIELSAVEDHDGILTIRGGGARRDWNGIHYKQGMSAKNVGTTKLSANIATIPPGGVAYAHIHVEFEVILYILEGKVRHEFGSGLKKVLENKAGDFIYIKPGVPHEVFNMRDTELVAAPIYNYDVAAAAKNMIELAGSAWENKVVGFLCAAGGTASYMSVMAYANSLMLDFRCVIIPRFVFATSDAFDGDNITDKKIIARTEIVADELVRFTKALRS